MTSAACIASAFAGAPTPSATVLVKDGKFIVDSPKGVSTDHDRPTLIQTKTRLTVTCGSGVDCGKLGAQLVGASGAGGVGLPAHNRNARSVDFDLAPTGLASVQFVSGGEPQGAAFWVTNGDASPPADDSPPAADGAGNTVGRTLEEMLLCSATADANQGTPYDEEGNRATFGVTATGAVLWGPFGQVDENDQVVVKVYACSDLLPRLRVRRISAARVGGTLSLVGAPDHGSKEGANGIEPCSSQEFTLGDFAPGTGTVEISAHVDGKDVVLGTFDFNVNKLYHGMLSIGAVRTEHVDPEGFLVVSRNGQNLVAAKNAGSGETHFAVFFTPFVWGPRDIEKPLSKRALLHRVNPSFGVVTQELGDHALLGLSVDLPSVLLTGGVHWDRQTILNPASGLTEGSQFDGDPSTIPTARKWRHSAFWGVTIDLRAMTALMGAATSAKY